RSPRKEAGHARRSERETARGAAQIEEREAAGPGREGVKPVGSSCREGPRAEFAGQNVAPTTTRGARQSRPPRSSRHRSFRERLQLHFAEENLGSLRLQADFSAGGFHLRRLVDQLAIQDDANPIVLTGTFQRVPFAGRILDVVRSMIPCQVLPVVAV